MSFTEAARRGKKGTVRVGDLREVGLHPLRTNFPSTGHRPSQEELRRRIWQDERILVINLDDERIGWDYRAIVEAIGRKVYGAPAK